MSEKLILGDCLYEMPKMEENSVDTIITDPPYGLDFMGKDWDNGVPGAAFWVEALRVAKPGAMLFAFGGTRTVHRLACAIEDAGWIIRDRIAWIYGSGFPKSHNISKAIDKAAGTEREVISSYEREGRSAGILGKKVKITRDITVPATQQAIEWDGYGTALKPAHEPIIVAMKPLDGTFANNAQKWGVAGLWIDGGRVPTDDNYTINTWDNGAKPFGDGAGNPYTSRQETGGRWPANLIHDGSDEVKDIFPQTGKSSGGQSGVKKSGITYSSNWNESQNSRGCGFGDSGSAARFFYCSKASKAERNAGLEDMEAKRKAGAEFRPNHMEKAKNGDTGNPYGRWGEIQNNHPTVKPISLMRYLCRLSRTPQGGVVLDPFMGSGSTGVAAILEGRSFIGIDLEAEYVEIASKRIDNVEEQLCQ